MALDEADGVEPSEEAQEAAKKAQARAEVTKTEPQELKEGEPPKPEAPEAPEDEPKVTVDKLGREHDAKTGKLLPKKQPTEAKTPEKAAVPPGTEPEQPEATLTREQKDEARLARNRREFEEEKRMEREWIKAEKERIQREAAELQQRQGPPRISYNGYTAPQYRQYSADFFKDAEQHRQAMDYEKANEALSNAYKALNTAEQIEAKEQQQQAQTIEQTYKSAFEQDMERVQKEHPETVYDHENPSPIAQEIHTVLGVAPELYWMQGGFQKAYEIAVLRQRSARLEELEAELAQERAERKKLQGKLEPASSEASRGAYGEKSFKDMSWREKEQYLEQQARELDQQGVSSAGVGFQ
jgi:hypothetical protein